ncbi:MAG TPA: hypothetical protein VKN14_06790 [Flavobacteriaceae bacterium]|nr:hypothetical protein [Flavobacteriaceae bacterium]
MKKIFLIIIYFIVLISCSKKDAFEKEIDKEFKQVKVLEDKKAFLQKIYNDSQALLLQKKELEKNFFRNKDSIRLIEKIIDSNRVKNFYRSKKYINKYNYPGDSLLFSENERLSIYYAILDQKKLKIHLAFLPIFKNVYSRGVINKYEYLDFLFKIYYLKNASFFQYDKRHSIEEIIEDIEPEILK